MLLYFLKHFELLVVDVWYTNTYNVILFCEICVFQNVVVFLENAVIHHFIGWISRFLYFGVLFFLCSFFFNFFTFLTEKFNGKIVSAQSSLIGASIVKCCCVFFEMLQCCEPQFYVCLMSFHVSCSENRKLENLLILVSKAMSRVYNCTAFVDWNRFLCLCGQ